MWPRRNRDRSLSRNRASAPRREVTSRLALERLEDRQLLASLQPITNLTVPTKQGYTVPLLASPPNSATPFTHPQTFTVTSSNPEVAASIASGDFWTVNVSYTDPNNATNDFSGPLTFQLFKTLTPNTVNEIQTFTNDGWYTNKFFTRIFGGFPNATDFIAQGGAPNRTGTGSSGQPGTPFANENIQQLAFTGVDQLAMANANQSPGTTPTNDTQFFITTGSPNSALGYGYTIFGQMLAGQTILAKMTQVPVQANPVTQENSYPVNPINITSASLAVQNPNGVLILDASQAAQGQTSTITVTATDTLNGTKYSQSFVVTVGAYAGPTSPPINFKPFANAVSATTKLNTATAVTLAGTSGYPNSATPSTLSYALLTQPRHGTITNFNATTGTFTYTPNTGFIGTDTLSYQVTGTGPQQGTARIPTSLTMTSNPATVTLQVGPIVTGTVALVGPVLFVTPLPRYDKGTNTIEVTQAPNPSGTGSDIIEVTVNGVLDSTQPAISSLNEVVVFGGRRANNDIVVDPSVTIPVTLDGGHGLFNYVTGGSGFSREHGWFGVTTLIGGPGPNKLIGLAGHVRFRPSKSTTVIFAGMPHRRTSLLHPVPPTGTYYKFEHGKLIPIGGLIRIPKAARLGPNHPLYHGI